MSQNTRKPCHRWVGGGAGGVRKELNSRNLKVKELPNVALSLSQEQIKVNQAGWGSTAPRSESPGETHTVTQMFPTASLTTHHRLQQTAAPGDNSTWNSLQSSLDKFYFSLTVDSPRKEQLFGNVKLQYIKSLFSFALTELTALPHLF